MDAMIDMLVCMHACMDGCMCIYVCIHACMCLSPAFHISCSKAGRKTGRGQDYTTPLSLNSGGWSWPTVNAPYGGSVLTRLTLGALDSGLEGAESAKRDATPWSIYDGPLATA